MDDCECDIVREVRSGIEIGVDVQPSTCLCNYLKISVIRITLTDKVGGFTAWPDTIDIPMIHDIWRCSISGEVTNILGDWQNNLHIFYFGEVNESWLLYGSALALGTDPWEFIGENDWQDNDYVFGPAFGTSNLRSCNPGPFPGIIGYLSGDSGASVTLSAQAIY